MSADKYLSIFSRQMETIVYLLKSGSLDNEFERFHWLSQTHGHLSGSACDNPLCGETYPTDGRHLIRKKDNFNSFYQS